LIAKKYGVRIQDIVALNHLQSARYIRPGQILKIPTNGYSGKLADIVENRKIYYTVRRGDTLSEIAEKHRTSVRKIKKWNGLRSDFIREGQKLIIWKNA
jgi:membrane-bound lytic murein transglycosylase D